MRIHLPNSAFIGNLDAFIRSLDFSRPEKLILTANEKWISVHPVVLAMIAAVAQTIQKDNISCEPFSAKSAHYFERMRLFQYLGISSGISVTEHESAGRFIPLTQIRNSTELSRFVTDMIPLLHLEPRHAEPIRYVVSELLRNVLEHAESPHGAFVAAQYYVKSNTIRIGIADTGVGIRRSLSRAHPTTDDLGAVRLSLMPGITGTTRREGGTEQNAGAGLFFVKSIAAVNGDFFALYSGSAFFKLLRQRESKRHLLHADPFDDRHSAANDLPAWPGTAVGIDMTLDENETFSSLLDHIRDVYGRTVRERKRTRYKQPQFV